MTMDKEDIFEDFPHSPTCYTSKGVKFHRTEFCKKIIFNADPEIYYWQCENCGAKFNPNGDKYGE